MSDEYILYLCIKTNCSKYFDSFCIFNNKYKRIHSQNLFAELKDDDICFYKKDNYNIYQGIKYHKNNEQKENNNLFLHFKKCKEKGDYEIINPFVFFYIKKSENTVNSLNERFWYVINSSNDDSYKYTNENYILNKNDIIKFGRIKYEIIEKNINMIDKDISLKNNNKDNYNISNINSNSKPVFNIEISSEQYIINDKEKNENEINKNEKKCKLCSENNSNIDNPKVCLCSCNDFIHYKCLKKYLNSKLYIKENIKKTVTTYNFIKFNCQKCSELYPLRFKIQEFDKIYELFDLDKPSNIYDYIILESLDYFVHNNYAKIIHIVKLIGDDEIKIGRNNDNDIIDTDLSISRNHAVIKFHKESRNLILESKSDKSNTLVLIRGNIRIKPELLNFQIGSTYIITGLVTKEKYEIIKNL